MYVLVVGHTGMTNDENNAIAFLVSALAGDEEKLRALQTAVGIVLDQQWNEREMTALRAELPSWREPKASFELASSDAALYVTLTVLGKHVSISMQQGVVTGRTKNLTLREQFVALRDLFRKAADRIDANL